MHVHMVTYDVNHLTASGIGCESTVTLTRINPFLKMDSHGGTILVPQWFFLDG